VVFAEFSQAVFYFGVQLHPLLYQGDGDSGKGLHPRLRFQETPLWFGVVLGEFSFHGEAPPFMRADLAEDKRAKKTQTIWSRTT
jgi:hypothetical protein